MMLASGCAAVKGYHGPELPRNETAEIRVGWDLSGMSFMKSISARMRDPVSGKSSESPFLLDVPGQSWVAVLPPRVCVTVSAQPMFCMPLSQCVPNARPIAIDERQVCFDVSAGSRYRVDAKGVINADCWGGIELTGYHVTHVETDDAIAEFLIPGYCNGFMETKVGEWAAAYAARDGTWGERTVWRVLNAEMLKSWARTPAYAEWWPDARELFTPEFAAYVDKAVSAPAR